MNHVGPYPPVSHTHEKLAEKYSAEAVAEQVADLMIQRDRAIREFYLNYGLGETVRRFGWSKPTVMMAVRKAAAK
jgi:hypothetical protein